MSISSTSVKASHLHAVEIEGHQQKQASAETPFLFQIHWLHQSLCPLISAQKCCEDFGVHFKYGRKVLHNLTNAPQLPCPMQATVASFSF